MGFAALVLTERGPATDEWHMVDVLMSAVQHGVSEAHEKCTVIATSHRRIFVPVFTAGLTLRCIECAELALLLMA